MNKNKQPNWQERFDEKFRELVKPAAYNFNKNGTPYEVEAMVGVKNDVIAFIEAELEWARAEERERCIRTVEKLLVKNSLHGQKRDDVQMAYETGIMHSKQALQDEGKGEE